jgi:hypothetical protein
LLAASRPPHAFPRIPLLPYLPGLHLHLTCPWAVAVAGPPGSIGAKTSAGLYIRNTILPCQTCGGFGSGGASQKNCHRICKYWNKFNSDFYQCVYFRQLC